MTTRTETLCDALERLEGYEYLDLPGPFACHGPMGAETLSTLGHNDVVPSWAEAYKAHHQPLDSFSAVSRIDPADEASWRPALGAFARVNDWAAMFRTTLEEQPWQQVLRRWLPRLLAGYAGGLTHGIIRTAHAVRALPDDELPPRPLMGELARSLAFWAALYTPLPGRPQLSGSLDLDQAIAALPRPKDQWAPMEAGTFARIREIGGFPTAVEALGPPANLVGALSDLSGAFCRIVLADSSLNPVPLVHTVTPIGAARILAPYLTDVPADHLYSQLWQVNAAILCGFTASPLPRPAGDTDRELPSPEELTGRAADHKDPHVLKFTEACVREHATNPNPIYLLAADGVQQRTPPW